MPALSNQGSYKTWSLLKEGIEPGTLHCQTALPSLSKCVTFILSWSNI